MKLHHFLLFVTSCFIVFMAALQVNGFCLLFLEPLKIDSGFSISLSFQDDPEGKPSVHCTLICSDRLLKVSYVFLLNI